MLYTKLFHNNIEKLLAEIINLIIVKKRQKITLIDIGAFRGMYSEKINLFLKKKLFTNLNFYLVDPNPNFKKYLQNLTFKYNYDNVAIKNNKNIPLLSASAPFYINNQFEGSGSSLKSLFSKNKYYTFSRRLFFLSFRPLYRVIMVRLLTLNQFFKKNKINNFTVLKIDAEGSELDILESGHKYLNKGKVISIEISALKKNYTRKYDKIAKLLFKHGFVIFKSFPIIEGSIFTNLKLCDCIFVKKKYFKFLNSIF